MRIAFDGKKAAFNRAGLGNYSRFVIRAMAKRFPDCQFDVYVSRKGKRNMLDTFDGLTNVRICYPTLPVLKHFPKLWERFGITREVAASGAEIYHGLGNELPANIRKAKGTRSIVTIHDLIFLFFPHTYSWIDRHFYNIRFRSACMRADRIVAVSNCTAKDIVKYYFIPKQKISIVYQGCDSRFRERCSENSRQTVKKKFSLPERFVLTVGTIEERKNAALIVEALKEIDGLDLVIVGKRTPYTATVEEKARELALTKRVHILENVETEDLPAIYQLSEIFAYPSRYEGFGIPLLEALCSGVPAIGATGSCLEEAGGSSSLYVDPDDAKDLAAKIVNVLSDRELRERMISRGLAYSHYFDEEVLADRLMEIYRDVRG